VSLQFNLLPFKDLARGLDLRSAESNVADGYAEDLQNVDTVSSGQLQKRKGYQGYAGYVPFRVREVTHDGYQVNLKLDTSVDLSGLASSPLLIYGKFDQAETGDFSTTAQLRYYSGFSVDVREIFTSGASPLTRSASSHGFSTNDLYVYTLTSTSESDNSSSFALPDSIAVDSATFDATITYSPTSTERVFVVIVDKSAVAGATFVKDYSASPIAVSSGTITGTITAATHGLGNFNIVPKFYLLSGTTYTECLPDTLTINDTTGDVGFTMTWDPAFTFVDADVSAGDDTITEAGHALSDGDRVVLSTTGVLPAGLAAATYYYVVSATANTFKLSATSGGAAVDITAAAGGGTHTATPCYTGQVILDAVPAANYKQTSVPAGSTATITVTGLDTDFPYWSLYRLNGSSWELTLPDSVTVDVATDTMTVTITNSTPSPETYEFYYDFATIAANSIRVVDTQAASTSYTGTTITDPQLTIWGISHADRYSSSTGGQVVHIDSYKRDAEARLVCGLGGNLYAARTRTEIGSTYQLPQFSVDLDARIASNVSMAPLFQPTGTASSVRTRGIITGDFTGAYASVTGCSYVSAGVADYVISLPSKSGTLALASQIATTDYLTVAGMAHSIHNGSFKVVSVPSQDSSSVTVRVENSSVQNALFDEAGAAGSANVFTDNFTTTAAVNYILSDIITSDSISSSLTLAVKSVSSTTVTVSGVTSTVALAQGVNVFGTRTSYVQPLKTASSSVSSAQYLVKGDMVTLGNYQGTTLARQARVVGVNPYQDLSCMITVSSGTATAVVGTSKTVSAVSTGDDEFTSVAHGLNTNDPILLSTTTSLPAGLRSDVVYYVKKVDDDTFSLMADEEASGETNTLIDLTSAGSGTISVLRVHALSPGDRVTVSQTGDPLLDGVVTVVSVPSRASFTYTTTSTTSSASGVVVGRTAEFDESLTFSDTLSTSTTVTVSERWIPVEAPTATGNLPKSTYTAYWDDTTTRLRSVIVAGNMYFTNNSDELMKFDGTSLYQAGLCRWQPMLFAQLDTGTGSLTLDGAATAGAGTDETDVFTCTNAGDTAKFKPGDRVVFDQGDVRTVDSTDTDTKKIYLTENITSGNALTVRKIKTYKYYARLNAIDANNNVVASAATGSNDCVFELVEAGQVRLRLVPPAAFGIYDYDRVEVQLYRTVADTEAPFYRVRSAPVTFSRGSTYIDIYDSTTDLVLEQDGDLDSTMTALVGAELGTAWDQPPRAKYLTTTNNRLVLANIKDYQQLDITMRRQGSASAVTTGNLDGFTYTFRRSSTGSGTTGMVDAATYEFVNSGAVTIDPAADIATTATTFVVTENAHGLVVGDWVYFFHSAAGKDNDLHFAGWYQVAAKDTNTFTLNFTHGYTPGAPDVDRYVTATSGYVPVWLGTDGNFNWRNGNTSASYEHHAAVRLAAAVNASMVATDRTISGQTTFEPWLSAQAGSEYGFGQIVVRQPKYSSTTMEVLLGTLPTNCDVYVNSVKRATGAEVSATSLLWPSRVLISYENHPELFDNPSAALQEDSDSVVDVNSADGEEITGVVPFFAESAFGGSQVESLVVVFKTNSIYLLDVKTRQVQRIDSQGLGCTAPYSIAPTRNGIMFANLSGVYRLNRNLTVSYVGKFIERYWKDDVNATYLSAATGHNFGIGRQYKLSVPVDDDSTTSVVLVYDHTREGQEQEFGAWTKYTNHQATGWANLEDNSYFATTDGQVFKIRSANDASDYRDDAAAVAEMVILLKSQDAGLPGVRKVVRGVVSHMRMDKTSVTGTTIYAAVDNSETFESAGAVTATLGTTKVQTFRSSLPTARFTYLQLKYVNSTKDENFVLAGVDMLVAALTNKGVTERSEMS
jgi:hypothetical protein